MKHNPIKGASAIIIAGLLFATINILTQVFSNNISIHYSNVAFYQYLFALFFLLPSFLKIGLGKTLYTRHFGWHVVRILLSVIGIQLWIKALVHPIPIWKGIALLMTSPFFVILGSGIFLKEKIGCRRWMATVLGFVGAMIILEPWDDRFDWIDLLPVMAAFSWACYSLLIKKLSSDDSPTTMVVYLFILITPFNLLIGFNELAFPDVPALGFLILLGFLTALAQLAVAKAYNLADASYLQPFDFLKLPMNIIAGWMVFSSVPPGRLWIGASIIVVTTLYLTHVEHKLAKQISVN